MSTDRILQRTEKETVLNTETKAADHTGTRRSGFSRWTERRIDQLGDFIEAHQRLPRYGNSFKESRLTSWMVARLLEDMEGRLDPRVTRALNQVAPMWNTLRRRKFPFR